MFLTEKEGFAGGFSFDGAEEHLCRETVNNAWRKGDATATFLDEVVVSRSSMSVLRVVARPAVLDNHVMASSARDIVGFVAPEPELHNQVSIWRAELYLCVIAFRAQLTKLVRICLLKKAKKDGV